MRANFDLFLLRMLGAWWQNVSALLLLFLAARGAGCWVLPRRRDEFVRLALGMVLLAGVYPWWWGNIPGWTGMILLIPAVRGAWDIPWKKLKRDRLLYSILGIFGAATLASAFLPPFLWDEQVYQSVLYARFPETAGRIDNPYSAYPLLPQLFMMWVRSWGGLALPRLTVWVLSLFLAGKLYLEARRRSGSVAFGAVSSVCVMLSPLALVLHNGFYAESFIAVFSLAGFLVLEGADEKSGKSDDLQRQLIAGCFAGACAAVKLTGVGAALMLMIFASKRRRFKSFFSTAALTALPFFIRPWLTFGNPFYPFGSAWWGSEKARMVEDVFRALGDYGPGKFFGTAVGWLAVCFTDGKLYDGVVCGFGVLALVILLLVSLVRRHDRASLISFAALVTGYIFWALTSQQSRFLYPLLFVAVLLLADNFQVFAERNVRLAVLALPLLGMGLSWKWTYPQLRHHVTAWRILPMARREPGRFLTLATKDPAYFNSLMLLNTVAPEEARVLLLCERRSLYIPRRCEHGTPLFQAARLTPVTMSAGELWQGIKDFDYVLFGSTQNRVDQLKGYDQVEKMLLWQLRSLERKGRLRRLGGDACQSLYKVVHEP